MHSQHGTSHTSVSLLQIRVKLEMDTQDFFRALNKIASTMLTATYMCNYLFSPKLNCIYFIATSCFKKEEFNCTCEVCCLVFDVLMILNSTGLASLLHFSLVPLCKPVIQRVISFLLSHDNCFFANICWRMWLHLFENLNILLPASFLIHAH